MKDMLTSCAKVLDRAERLKQSELSAPQPVDDTILRNLALIGEAARRVDKSIQEAHPEIPWRLIIDRRNELIHDYWDIDNDTIWDTIQNVIPDLVPALQKLLAAEDNSDAQQ